MNFKSGKIFSIAKDNEPVFGCTISDKISDSNGYYILTFSLAKNTSISPESYKYHKIIYVNDGTLIMSNNKILNTGDMYVTPTNIPIGTSTIDDCIYTEISLKEDSKMNDILKSGDVFSLKDIIPYRENKIVNMNLIEEEKLLFEIMSFSEGTGLSEHSAPGEALIFALDGEGIIGYEGKEYTIKAGENFKFDKNGAHYVKAVTNFKMALMLTYD